MPEPAGSAPLRLAGAPSGPAIPNLRRQTSRSCNWLWTRHIASRHGVTIFRPDFLEIPRLLPAARHVPIQALTATATPRVRDEIREALQLGSRGFEFTTF